MYFPMDEEGVTLKDRTQEKLQVVIFKYSCWCYGKTIIFLGQPFGDGWQVPKKPAFFTNSSSFSAN